MTPESGALDNVPAHVRAEEGATNLLGDLGGASFPRLTFKSNRFRVIVGEEETVLEETRLNTILLDAYPKVSRIFFKGSYGDDGADTRPTCASADGEVPLPTVAEPQSNRCSTCPQNEKGSSVGDDGGKRRACSFFKRVVFLLLDYPEFGPVVSDLKSMSLFGDSYADKGYLNLRAYADMLARHRTKPEAVVTELSFDTNASVPKVLFRAVAYVEEDTYFKEVEPLLTSGQTAALADCTQIRTEGSHAQGAAPEQGGFRDKLLENKPQHAQKEEAQKEAEEKPAAPTQTKGVRKKRTSKKAPATPEPEVAAHPKFCSDCGAKWGTCEHTAATTSKAAKSAPVEAEEEDESEFDKDLQAALAEYGED
jgi:hypothetical protein